MGFQWALTLAELSRSNLLARLHGMSGAAWWGWAVLPAIGFVLGSAVGYSVKKLAPDASGSGIPHIKGVLINLRVIRWKALTPVKFIGGVLGIGAGLSMGREGPTVQMGACVGKMVADWMKLPPRAIPQLISCGAGAGLAAAFNAPLAGFLFVLEELHREMSALTFGGALIAAVLSDIVARSLTGQLPSFSVHGFPALPLGALPAVAVIGAVGGVLGVFFNQSLLVSQAWARRVKVVPRWMLPGIVAAMCGLVAWWMPGAVGGGHSVAENLMTAHSAFPVQLLLSLLAMKFVLTILSYGSGAPGGIFAPMLLMGVIAGALIGRAVTAVYPSIGHDTPAFAVLGMAAIFTGSVRAPLTGMVLILEMTGNYEQLLALSVACVCAYLVAEALGDHPIYEALLAVDLRERGVSAGPEEEPRSVVIGIQTSSSVAGKTLREAGFPAGCLVVMVERAGREIMPRATLQLAPGDHITVLVPAHEPEKALAVVDLCVYHG